jgi:hypothetical protein
MPEPDYYQLPNYVSQSSLKVFIRNPLDYKYQFVDGNAQWASTPNMALGILVHCLLLEPRLVDQQYVVFNEDERPEPDKTMASNLNKAWKASLERDAQESGTTVIGQELYNKADAMLQVACAHGEAMTWLVEGHPHLIQHNELAIFWRNDCSELPLKSKLDRLLIDVDAAKAWVVDYKTTSASNAQEFGWSVKKYGYDIQAAFYEDAARDYLELNHPGITFDVTVLFIPQRTAPPYQVLGVLQLDRETLSRARAKYERALQELEGCLHTGIWEQQDGIQTLYLSKPLEGIFLPDTELIL